MLDDDKPLTVAGAPHILAYQDAELPSVIYFASTRPAVARGSGDAYQLALVHYDKPVGGKAGMLSLVIDLRPSPDQMARLRAGLADRMPGVALQFKPIPWTAGTVAAALIGGQPVRATPSLLGDNSVALSIGLDLDQYLLLRKSSGNAAAPLSVVYGLSYESFRRQYAYSIAFDETAFRDWLQRKCTANLLFVEVEKVETFEELRRAGVVRIVNENQTGEAPPDGVRRAFLQSLQGILVPLPSFAPVPGTSGGTWQLGFDCSAVRDVQQIARHLDTRLQVQGAVARQAFIQGPVDGLAEALAARPDIELPTGVSFTQALTIRCHGVFDDAPLHSVIVSIEPPPARGGSHVFERAGESTIELAHPPGQEAVHVCRCRVSFGDGTQGEVTQIPIRRDQAFLDIVAPSLYTYRCYTAGVDAAFPWDLVRSIRVVPHGPAGLRFQPEQIALSEKRPECTLAAFHPAPVDLDAVGFTATYTPAPGAGDPFDWSGAPTGATMFLDPFTRRDLRFRVADGFDWNVASKVVVTIAPAAGRAQLWRNRQLTLTRAAPQGRTTCWYANDRTTSCRVSYLQGDRTFFSTTTESLQADIVLAAPDLVTHPSKESP